MYQNRRLTQRLRSGLLVTLVSISFWGWSTGLAQGRLLEGFPLEFLLSPQGANLTVESENPVQETSIAQADSGGNTAEKEKAVYQVAPGDTLYRIAREHQMDWHLLARANALEDGSRLRVGQRIEIPGAEETTALLASQSSKSTASTAKSAAKAVSSKTISSSASQVFKSKNLAWPVKGRVSSTYGQRNGEYHHGLDIAATTGTPIQAVAGGKVTWSGEKGVYGLAVMIDHGDGWKTLYGHASKLLVKSGETVNSGETIAEVGSTGRSTGPHVHFEIYQQGSTVNPQKYLQ